MSHANSMGSDSVDPISMDHYIEELRRVTAQTSDENQIIARIGPLAQRVVKQQDWLKPKHYETDSEQGFGVHLLHEEPDHTLAVFIVAWLPGRGTPPHDHGTWAVVAGVEGVERNIRYERLDDRSRKGYAQLGVKHDFRTLTLMSLREGTLVEWHRPTDVIEKVDADLVARSERFLWELLLEIDKSPTREA